MKTQLKIFSKFTALRAMLRVGFCTLFIIAGGAFAAGNGCDTEGNEFINANLALCTSHAYNIARDTNPETPAEREKMNEVVALKTTIMTQQMKKQYDYLDTTVRRFKTQLQKAILVAKLEAAGASESENSGTSSKSKTTMGDDCTGKNRIDTVYCLRQNYAKMRTMVEARNFGNDLKEQIVKDVKAIGYMDSKLMADTAIPNCKDKSKLTNITIPDCLGQISGAINSLEEGGKQKTVSAQQIPG